ncbi:MAG: DUF3854 domain-containing protein [Actinomycetia bacterium]|nr:DUF3854 domain-containing protein [Actinomycetes bacterium]
MDFDAVKQAVRIEAIIGAHVALTPHGHYAVGRCPFHDDRGRPNLVVFLKSQTYRCYVCGAHGDAIDFVARWAGVSQGEAARRLREGLGSLGDPPRAMPRPAPPAEPARAPLATRDRAYQALLAACPLSDAHRTQLEARGLSSDAIAANGYGTLRADGRHALAEAVWAAVGDAHGVPGLAYDPADGAWRVDGPPGLLIPVRDADGRIQACQVRPDTPRRGKYVWLSTPDGPRRRGGASSGVPVHVAGRAFRTAATPVWVTEGPLKADIAAHFLQTPVLGVAGAGNARGVVDWLSAWRPPLVVLAFDDDPDPATRAAVGRQVKALADALRRQGLAVARTVWDTDKGLDDALRAGRSIRLAALF